MKRLILIFAAAVVAVLLVVGGSWRYQSWQDDRAFARAEQQAKAAGVNTEAALKAYQAYMRSFPVGHHWWAARDQAVDLQSKLDGRAFARAEQQAKAAGVNTEAALKAYQAYMRSFPAGQHVLQARQQAAELRALARHVATVARYNRIREGMTLVQVAKIMGGSPSHSENGRDGTTRYWGWLQGASPSAFVSTSEVRVFFQKGGGAESKSLKAAADAGGAWAEMDPVVPLATYRRIKEGMSFTQVGSIMRKTGAPPRLFESHDNFHRPAEEGAFILNNYRRKDVYLWGHMLVNFWDGKVRWSRAPD